jgi:hypothetical protein
VPIAMEIMMRQAENWRNKIANIIKAVAVKVGWIKGYCFMISLKNNPLVHKDKNE